VNKAKTRDAEEANIVTILSRSDAIWSIGRRDYHVDARQQILSDRQQFFFLQHWGFYYNILVGYADLWKKFADGQKTLPTRLDWPLKL